MSNQKVHDDLVKRVGRILEAKGCDVEYKVCYEYGELDIKVIRNGYTRYYEVKGIHGDKAYQHAKNQMYKFYNKYPFDKDDGNTKGGKTIYVSQRKDNSLVTRIYRGRK